MKLPNPYPQSPLEITAAESFERGICRFGNHAVCIYEKRAEKCTPPVEAQVERARAWLALGQWPDGAGSYGLKHRVEELDDRPDYYVSNGALLLAAARMGLGLVWSFPYLNLASPNARIRKFGKVPQAKRGPKCKSMIDGTR